MKFIFRIFFLCLIFTVDSQANIQVVKKNVLYEFVPFDDATDHFVKNVFPNWEPETFDVFDIVKEQEGIAIDLGAWIGTTAIWLSKNFSHVVAVDADIISLGCLEKNLQASHCPNVTICNYAIADKNGEVIFGPRGRQVLNDSMSCIKEQAYHQDDYMVKAITLAQLLNDYIYINPSLSPKKISFIKCDIEGGEEYIIEDLLNFAYQNKTKVYLSFHTHWWLKKKISDFEHLFKKFRTNCPQSNICEYITENPLGSLLFEPLD